jgi:hypothetical protein
VPLNVVHCQMAPMSVTTHCQSHQNRMLLTSQRNRIFLDAGAFYLSKNVPDCYVVVSNPVASYLCDKYRARQEIMMMLTSVHCIWPAYLYFKSTVTLYSKSILDGAY